MSVALSARNEKALLPRTAIHLGHGEIYSGETLVHQFRRGLYNHDSDEQETASKLLVKHPFFRVQHGEAPAILNFSIESYIAGGAFGAVFLCTNKDDTRYAVKLFKKLVKPVVMKKSHSFLLNSMQKQTIQKILQPVYNIQRYEKVYAYGKQCFKQEFSNAERILEPKYVRILRRNKKKNERRDDDDDNSEASDGENDSRIHTEDAYVGEPLVDLNGNEYFELLYQIHIFQAHPGYAHLHQVLHLDMSIPAIISEPAHGSLLSLSTDPAVNGALHFRSNATDVPPLWLCIAHQVAMALQFMDEKTPLVHVDLKPDNILYRGDPRRPSHFCCLVSDYGICSHKTFVFMISEDGKGQQLPGTFIYNPPIRRILLMQSDTMMAPQPVPARALSMYQYFATLVDLMVYSLSETPYGHATDTRLTSLTSDPCVPQPQTVYTLLFKYQLDDSTIDSMNCAIKTCFDRARHAYYRNRAHPTITSAHNLFLLTYIELALFHTAPDRWMELFTEFAQTAHRQYSVLPMMQDAVLSENERVLLHARAARNALVDKVLLDHKVRS